MTMKEKEHVGSDSFDYDVYGDRIEIGIATEMVNDNGVPFQVDSIRNSLCTRSNGVHSL